MRSLAVVCLVGCSMTKLTANQTADILALAPPSMAMESDTELARNAAPAQLKTIEGFWFVVQDNRKLIRLLAQGYCEYAFGFLDSDLEASTMAGRDDDELRRRTTDLYRRCTKYGLRLLDHSWEKAMTAPLTEFRDKVAHAGRGEVEGMFFTALGLASAININRDDLAMVADLPRARMMFERIVQLDETFYNGGAHTALGMMYAARGTDVGGNPAVGGAHFDRAIALTGGKFLMPKVLKAYTFAVTTNDRRLFHDSLVEVLRTPGAVWPEQRLANELAHARAERYLAHEADLF